MTALCAQTDPEVFASKRAEPSRIARKICADCPFTQECARLALSDTRELYGTWGGVTIQHERGGHPRHANQALPWPW